MLSIIRYYWSI